MTVGHALAYHQVEQEMPVVTLWKWLPLKTRGLVGDVPKLLEAMIGEASTFDEFAKKAMEQFGTHPDDALEMWETYWGDIVAEQRENEAIDELAN